MSDKFSSLNSAARFREFVRKTAREVQREERPLPKYAVVQSVDHVNNEYVVRNVGSTVDHTVPSHVLRPDAGSTVRLGGRPGKYHIEAILDGIITAAGDFEITETAQSGGEANATLSIRPGGDGDSVINLHEGSDAGGDRRYRFLMEHATGDLKIQRYDGSGSNEGFVFTVDGTNGHVSVYNKGEDDVSNLSEPPYLEATTSPGATSGDTTLSGWSASINRGGWVIDNGGAGADSRINFPETGTYLVSIIAQAGTAYSAGASGVAQSSANGMNGVGQFASFPLGTGLAVTGTTLIRCSSGGGAANCHFFTRSGGTSITRVYRLICAKVANY